MWIFAGGMFRSGSTLQYQMLCALLEDAGLGRRVPWRMPEEFAGIADEGDRTPDRLVFKTHVCKHPMRVRLRDGRALGVSAHRDLRDVVVSGARKSGVDPTPAFCRELVTGCLACANGWPDTPGFLEWRYTDLVTNPAGVLIEMAEHLSVPCSAATAAGIAERFTPDAQRTRIEHAEREGLMHPAVEGGSIHHMARELLHPNHIQDGRTGVWRELLTPDAVETIESLAAVWLSAHGYEITTHAGRAALATHHAGTDRTAIREADQGADQIQEPAA